MARIRQMLPLKFIPTASQESQMSAIRHKARQSSRRILAWGSWSVITTWSDLRKFAR